MSDLTTLAAIVVGILAGFITAYLAYQASTEKWDNKKFVPALLTSIIAAVAISVGLGIEVNSLQNAVIVFLAASGTEYMRNKIAAATKTTKPGT